MPRPRIVFPCVQCFSLSPESFSIQVPPAGYRVNDLQIRIGTPIPSYVGRFSISIRAPRSVRGYYALFRISLLDGRPPVVVNYPSTAQRIVQFPQTMSEYISGGVLSGRNPTTNDKFINVFYRCRDDQALVLCVCVIPWLWTTQEKMQVLFQFDCSVSLYFPPPTPPSDSIDVESR
jgi:hypothetical protein